jgi:hypothetical protein
MENDTSASSPAWFHEDNGQRKGPVTHAEILSLIKSGAVTYGTAVWRKEYPDWLAVENTDLRPHLLETAPPPLSGVHVNNTFVWILAFAPLIGLFLEGVVAGLFSANDFAADLAISNSKYWFVTLILNIGLSYLDERKLKAAGHNTDKFKGWVWLVPVYLFQRAKAMKQNLAYFIVWIVCFVASLCA